MNKILTIVIPSYNTGKYIDECLPYILNIRNIEDVEILIIDDGSTDDTAVIAEKYAGSFPESVKIISKDNGGHGSVINKGIELARGKYFKVIDGDDWVVTKNLTLLVEKLKIINADLVVNPYIKYHIVKKQKKVISNKITEYGIEQKFDFIANKINPIELHAITIKTSILKENKIVLEEKCYYEDSEYNLYPVPYIDSIMFYSEPVYVYRIGSPTQSVTIKNVVKNIEMHQRILNNMITFFGNLPSDVSKEKYTYIMNVIVTRIHSQYGIYLKFNISQKAKEKMLQFDERIKRLSPELYKTSGTLPIRLIRTKLGIFYVAAHYVFQIKRRIRGY